MLHEKTMNISIKKQCTKPTENNIGQYLFELTTNPIIRATKYFYSTGNTSSSFNEVRNFRVTKSNYEIELRKLMSHFELLTRKCLKKFFF